MGARGLGLDHLSVNFEAIDLATCIGLTWKSLNLSSVPTRRTVRRRVPRFRIVGAHQTLRTCRVPTHQQETNLPPWPTAAYRMTPATPAVCSPLGHASPESNVGRQASSAPTRLIPGPSQSSNPRTLMLIPPFYQSQPVICAVHCDRTLTEPCWAEPHVTSAGPSSLRGIRIHGISPWDTANHSIPIVPRRPPLPTRGPSCPHSHRGCSPPLRWKAAMMLVGARIVKGSRPGAS